MLIERPTRGQIEELISKIPSSTIIAGEKIVADSATPEKLADDVPCTIVIIQAKLSNSGNVFIGNSMNQYIELQPGDSIERFPSNLNLIYVKVEVNGDGVNYGGES